MKLHRYRTHGSPFPSLQKSLEIACALVAALLLGGAADARGGEKSCTQAAKAAYRSCRLEALGDYWLALGKCANLSSAEEILECRNEARGELLEAKEECRDQYEARRDLCEIFGEDPYNPVIDPANFVAGVDNPYFPLVPGKTNVYEGMTANGLEHTEVKVTGDTKEILGVTCVVVRDTVSIDGEVIEDTLDWFAQDVLGNVWYFGEHSEEFEDGVLVGLEGSWEAGVDGARPGIIMEADPQPGDIYRQEFLLGTAEDIGEVLALGQSVAVPFGEFNGCLQTADSTPLEPDVLEQKFYAPGIGVVLEVDLESGERSELIDIISE